MVEKRQLGLFDDEGAPKLFSVPSSSSKPCKHPQKSIVHEMLKDTCTQCGATRTVKPDGIIGRVEEAWVPPGTVGEREMGARVDESLAELDDEPFPKSTKPKKSRAICQACYPHPWHEGKCEHCGCGLAVPTKPKKNEVDKRLTPADLSEDQAVVYKAIIKWIVGDGAYEPLVRKERRLLTIGGLAGSGKSTLIGVLAAQLSGKLVAYATYTGRASSVLARKLRAAGVHVTSHQAKPPDYKGCDPNRLFLDPHEMKLPFCGTLHKLLYRPVINDKEEITGWRKREELDRRYDLIVVDEASMVGDDMLLDLQHHRVPILAVGDHGQLPPVMASGNLMALPDLKLVKIHRQAKKNPIILFSRHVRKTGDLSQDFEDGKHIVFDSKKNVDEVLRDAYGSVESAIDVAVLCWTNRQRIRLNIAARKALGFKGAPHRGEILICLKNMRDSNADIYNGMRGVVNSDCFFIDGEWAFDCSVGFPEESILPRILSLCAPQFFRERVFESVDEMQERGIPIDTLSGINFFDFGYALTCHRAQGSQMKHVILWVEDGAQVDEKFWRRWVYTAVSRSSSKLTVLT